MSPLFLMLLVFTQAPLFEEPFSFGLSHDWHISDEDNRSHWQVEDGVLRQTKDKAKSDLFLTDPSFVNGTLLARISSQKNGGFGLLFRVQDAHHYYRAVFPEGRPGARLEKRNGSAVVVLDERPSPLPYPHGPWWTVAVKVEGDRLQVLLNGETMLEATDGKYAKGGIGVSCLADAKLRVDALAFFEEEVNSNLLEPRPAILTGPNMGCLDPHGFTVTWETSIHAPSAVEIIKGSDSRIVEGGPKEALFHELRVQDLEPDTAYRYKVISGPIQSPVFGVQTPPVESSSYKFCVYGDSRSAPDPHRFVIRAIRMQTPQFILHVGDLVTNGSRYEDWAPQFFGPADWLIHSLPFYVSMGNHEEKGPWFDAFLPLPGNKRFYDFTHGTAYFVALDSNQSLKEGSAQMKWLEEALASEKAKGATWRFCFFHHPPFSESKKGYHAPEGMVKNVVPLLQQSGVDLLFSGHNHNYERGRAGDLGLVVTGGGGAPLSYGENYRARDLPEISITRSVLNACLVEVDGGTLTFSAFTPDGKVFDSFTLTK